MMSTFSASCNALPADFMFLMCIMQVLIFQRIEKMFLIYPLLIQAPSSGFLNPVSAYTSQSIHLLCVAIPLLDGHSIIPHHSHRDRLNKWLQILRDQKLRISDISPLSIYPKSLQDPASLDKE